MVERNIGGDMSSTYSGNGVSDKRSRRGVKIVVIIIIVLLLLGFLAWILFSVVNKTTNQAANGQETIEIPLGALKDGDINLLGTGNLTMQGELNLQDGFVISPSSQPSNATPGQIYFDGSEIKYYNGSQFVSLATSETIEKMQTTIEEMNVSVETLQQQIKNQTTQVVQGGGVDFVTGAGLALIDGVLNNTGVTALQGQVGELSLVAGGGIAIDGLTVTNTGVRSIIAGSNITIGNDGSGNITVNSAAGGGGTVSSPGGTAGRIARFNGVQEIVDSIMTESGAAITVGGDLSVTNDINVSGDLNLTNALTVGNGGTGTTSLANNGVVIGQGANALTAVTAAGPGLCFMSTAGAPTFSACPDGGVTSLNGATGDLAIANSSTAGSTITLDDASTTQKGIAQFSSDNFTAAGGTIDTIQDINTSATPTFAGVNTNSITPSGALTIGATGQSFSLQGSSASTITATNGANTTTVNFAAPTGNRTITMPDESGTVCVQNSASCGFALADDAFLQGGNSFSATAVLGTQDSNSLEIITNNTTRLTIDPNGAVSNQGSLRNAGHLAVGGNSGVSNDTLISLDETFTSGTVTGVNGIIRLNPGATDSNYHTGMRYQLQTASGNVQNFTGGFRGVTAFVEHNGSGTMNEAWGGEFRVDNSSTGTINSAVGLRVQPNNNSGGGTIVDNYGLFIDSQTAGTNSNYALYTNSGTVRFGGVIQAQTLGTADTNTHLCRNSANQIATCSDASSTAFIQGGNGFGATAVLGTTDSNSLEIRTNGVTQATIAVGGATTFQNSANSTAAFRVLNAGSVPQFQIDTTNSRVYIGNLVADSTGALLVLDTKNTAGDPTGVNGGAYYNSVNGTSRCYEDAWTDCLGVSKPNTRRNTYFAANGTTTLSGYGDVLTHSGNSGSGAGNSAPPSISFQTGSVSGNSAGIEGNAIYGISTFATTQTYQSSFYLSGSTSVRVWAGLTNQTRATMAASATPAGEYAAFRYDTSAGDTNYQCVTSDGGTPTVTSSGQPANLLDPTFEISILGGTRAIFKINGRIVCDISTTIPSTTARIVNSVTTLAAANRTMGLFWVYAESDFVEQ